MEMQPEHYNESNSLHRIKANQLIDRIVEENSNKKFDYILDVGCGTGNITNLLNSRLNIKQLYAIDIDEGMIKFSKNNFSQNNIEYLVQDISVRWDQLRPEIKSLEAKVSLIFSNYALHWVNDKTNTAINIFRLLSNDGKLYANICIPHDLYPYSKPTEKEIYEVAIQIPTREQLLSSWEQAFKNAGFETVDIQFSVSEFLLDNQVYEKTIVPIKVKFHQTFIKEEDELKKKQLIAKIGDKILEMAPRFIEPITGKHMAKCESRILITKIVKNAY